MAMSSWNVTLRPIIRRTDFPPRWMEVMMMPLPRALAKCVGRTMTRFAGAFRTLPSLSWKKASLTDGKKISFTATAAPAKTRTSTLTSTVNLVFVMDFSILRSSHRQRRRQNGDDGDEDQQFKQLESQSGPGTGVRDVFDSRLSPFICPDCFHKVSAAQFFPQVKMDESQPSNQS